MTKVAESRIVQRNFGPPPRFDALVAAHADALATQVGRLRERAGMPAAHRQLRRFPTGEAARLIGITDAYLRQLILSDGALEPEKGPAGRRLFTLEQINQVRLRLGRGKPAYLPRRRAGEHLQVIAVANGIAASGKTTTAAHLAQYLALQGFRVLAVDLDPQGGLSDLFGCRADLEAGADRTLYGAVRRDGARRPLAEILRPSFFPGIALVPGGLELMAFEHEAPPEGGLRRTDGRFAAALAEIDGRFDVVVLDCPPQLGFLTLEALCAATGLLVTVPPRLADMAGLSRFLQMAATLLTASRVAGGEFRHDFLRYLVTRYDPTDGPQTQTVGLLRSLFGEGVLTHAMPTSAAIAAAGQARDTLYAAGREPFTRHAYDRAVEALDAVNGEIADQIGRAWGRGPA